MKSQRHKGKVWVQWNGRLYGLEAEKKRGASASETADELRAPFACKVLRVQARAGQTLKKGDPVVVVEAMKMEYAYASPREGTLAAVLVKEGDVVNAGTEFVRWETK